jgi:hypothetical protein
MARRPHSVTLRDAAIRYASHGIPVLPDQVDGRWRDLVDGAPVCTCHPATAQHCRSTRRARSTGTTTDGT